MEGSKKRVVILGAGFVGLPIACQVAKQAPECEVTLIDPKTDFVFTPRLIDALGEEKVRPERVRTYLGALAERRGFTFLRGRALSVSRAENMVRVETDRDTSNVPYDLLVIGTGVTTNWYNIPGAKDHALPLKTQEDVERIRTAVRARMNQDVKAPWNFVVVGGGPTGVESICALKQFVSGLDVNAGYTLVQAAPQILPGFPSSLVNSVRKELTNQGIEVMVGDPVTSVSPLTVTLASGATLPSSLTIWAAGTRPNPLPIDPEVGRDQSGCISVDDALRVDASIFAAGDAVLFRERNITVPKNAQTSLRMAWTLTRNVLHALRGEKLEPFHYISRGNLLLLGHTGIIDLGAFNLKTRFAKPIRDLFYAYRHRQMTN